MADIQLVVVGAGNMGEALLRGMLGAEILPGHSILAVEPLAERRGVLAKQLGINTTAELSQAAGALTYILAVKPQQMAALLPTLAAVLPAEGALVISIAAGISTRFLAEGLGPRARLVRAMPNTPMLVGCGCTGLCQGPRATEADLAFATRIFAASGQVHVVAESAIDAVTAVSGSGPAYFFYLIEAMVTAGVAEGLDANTALALARQTCAGAARLLELSGQAPEVLRQKVTSPGGTTQAAITTMEDAGVADILVRAVQAAARRSRELGK